MSPSAKGTHKVSETSNRNFSHENHINHVIAPHAPTGSAPQAPENFEPENTPDKKNKLRNRLIGGGVIALLAVTGGIIGVNAAKSGEKPPQATSSSAPANPEKTSTPETKGNNVTPEYTFTPDLINIPAGLSDQEYATHIVDDLMKWSMAGATDANYNKWVEGGLDDSLEKSIAADNLGVVQGSHLFSEAGLADSTIKLVMQNQTVANEGYIQAWFTTYNQPGQKPAAGQTEAFNETLSMDSFTATKTANGGREFVIEGSQHNNADKNTYSSHQNFVDQNGLKFELHITTSVAGGFEQIDTFTSK